MTKTIIHILKSSIHRSYISHQHQSIIHGHTYTHTLFVVVAVVESSESLEMQISF